MIFSELSAISDKTGLNYDDENAMLFGVKNNIPTAVFDNDARHRFDIVCGALVNDEVVRRAEVLTAQLLPAKTVLGIENAEGCLKIYCKGYNLMQENLPKLIRFLEKLTELCDSEKIAVTELEKERITALSSYAVIPKRRRAPVQNTPKSGKRPVDVKNTLKGVIGGIIGLLVGSSVFVVFIMLSDVVGWFGGVIMAAAVVSLYTVFSHKLKAPDVLITAVIILIGWLFSNTFAFLFRIFLNLNESDAGVNLFGIIGNLEYYLYTYYEYTNLYINSLGVSIIFVAAGAIGSYIFYYRYHAKDMY